MARMAAFIVLLIPILVTAGGIKLMRDSFFAFQGGAWLQFIGGLLMFLAGLGFLAGFLLRRDRRTGRVKEQLK